MTDLISETQPRIAAVLKSLYQIAITHLPGAWRAVYRLLENPRLTADNWLQAPLRRALLEGLQTRKPRLIVSTYPLYALLLRDVADRSLVPPLATIVTDSTSVHPIWTAAPSDLYCVADAETAEVLARQGVPPDRVRNTGFPVDLAFTAPLPPQASQAPQPQRILYLPSTPASVVARTLAALQPQLGPQRTLTLPAGRHLSRLYHVLRRFEESLNGPWMQVIGWTREIPLLLRTHDVVICKAGGAILHEVLAARTPAVIDYVVPGQEEGNAAYLVSRGCGVQTDDPAGTAAAVRRILENSGAEARAMRERMLPVSVPDAARRTAEAALTIARHP